VNIEAIPNRSLLNQSARPAWDQPTNQKAN
jgi:hypothetical protein